MTTPNNHPGNPQGEPTFWNGQPGQVQPSIPPVPYVDPRSANRSKGHGLSIAAFCLAFATILLVFPFTAISALPSLVGVPLAAVGLKRAGGRDGLAIAALVVVTVTFVLGIVMTFLFFQSVSRV